MGDLVHKTKVVPFIDFAKANEWTQIKKSTAFTLTTNPQTKTFDFISSEQPEEEIDSYQPSLTQNLTMFKDEPDYEGIFGMLYELPIGEAAHRPALLVFYHETAKRTTERTETRDVYEPTSDEELDVGKTYYEKDGDLYNEVDDPQEEEIGGYYEKRTESVTVTETATVYKAWKIDALVKVNQMDTVNEQIDFDLSFNNIKRGAAEIVDGKPVFTEGTFSNGTFTPAA